MRFSAAVEIGNPAPRKPDRIVNAARAIGIADRGYVLNMGQLAFDDTAQSLLRDDRVRRLFLGIRDGEDEGEAG